MNEVKIKPAQDSREWGAWLALSPDEREVRLQWAVDEVDADGYTTPRLLAAKALHGQPFGFSREHLKALGELIDAADKWLDARPQDHWNEIDAAFSLGLPLYREIAERIEALIPPEAVEDVT